MMMRSTDSTLVLMISGDLSLNREIEAAIQYEDDFLIISSAYLPLKIFEDLASTRPNIVILDIPFDQEENLSVIDQITSRFPGVAVVAILTPNQVNLTEKIILAGARAFLISPIIPNNLITTLRRIREIQARIVPPGPIAGTSAPTIKSRRNFVVFSPKGGAGCSTIAANLAIAMRQQLGEAILLIDGKHILGHISLMLNLRTGNSVTDLLAHVNQLDSSLIKQVVVEHISGISVLPSPNSILSGQGIKPEELFKVIQALKTIYPNIIVDGGNYLDDNLVTFMDTSNYILLIVNPNLASIRDARQFIDLSQHLSYSKDKIQVIVNQMGRKVDVKLNEIEKVLKTKILGAIPVDEDVALNSLNEGIPIIQKKSNHPISKSVTAIAKSLINLSMMSTISPDTQPKSAGDVLRKSSNLG